MGPVRTVDTMESAPTVEQFVNKFFRERTATLEIVSEIRKPYRPRYYHDDCEMDRRRGTVQRSESEKIVKILHSDAETALVTTGVTPPSFRSRYHIKSCDAARLIHQVDAKCCHIRAFGEAANCVSCGGTGWQSWNSLFKRNSEGASFATKPTPHEQPESLSFRDPDIVRFMTDHFRERTAVRQKELEIYARFARRFYSPDCAQHGWPYSVQERDEETVLSTKVSATWARVITCSGEFQLRYNLRRVGQSWLIVQVDLEPSGSSPSAIVSR